MKAQTVFMKTSLSGIPIEMQNFARYSKQVEAVKPFLIYKHPLI